MLKCNSPSLATKQKQKIKTKQKQKTTAVTRHGRPQWERYFNIQFEFCPKSQTFTVDGRMTETAACKIHPFVSSECRMATIQRDWHTVTLLYNYRLL